VAARPLLCPGQSPAERAAEARGSSAGRRRRKLLQELRLILAAAAFPSPPGGLAALCRVGAREDPLARAAEASKGRVGGVGHLVCRGGPTATPGTGSSTLCAGAPRVAGLLGAGRTASCRAGLCLLISIMERLAAGRQGQKPPSAARTGTRCRACPLPAPAAGSFPELLWETAPLLPVCSAESVSSLAGPRHCRPLDSSPSSQTQEKGGPHEGEEGSKPSPSQGDDSSSPAAGTPAWVSACRLWPQPGGRCRDVQDPCPCVLGLHRTPSDAS